MVVNPHTLPYKIGPIHITELDSPRQHHVFFNLIEIDTVGKLATIGYHVNLL